MPIESVWQAARPRKQATPGVAGEQGNEAKERGKGNDSVLVIVHISVAQAARLRAGSPRYRLVGNHQLRRLDATRGACYTCCRSIRMEKAIRIVYYEPSDELNILLGEPEDSVLQEIDDEIYVRLHPTTNEVLGFTILNFEERTRGTGEVLPLQAISRCRRTCQWHDGSAKKGNAKYCVTF